MRKRIHTGWTPRLMYEQFGAQHWKTSAVASVFPDRGWMFAGCGGRSLMIADDSDFRMCWRAGDFASAKS